MNKSPFNYFITFTIGGILWVVTTVVVGEFLGDRISLAIMSIDGFIIRFRIIITVATVIAISNSFYWYFYGGKDSTAGEINRAKSVWNKLFVGQIVAAVGAIITLGYMFIFEGISFTHYLIIFGLTSIHTYIFFWFCTFLMSPINVKYIPLFKR